MSDGAVQSPAGRLVMVGPHRVDGRAKGTYVSVVKADRNSVAVGVDGEGSFIDNGDESATITIALTPSSKSNLVFSAYYETGLAVPIAIAERRGTTVGGCVRAKITKIPDISWSDGAEVRAWVFVTTKWTGICGDMSIAELAQIDESTL